ncbi:hypothetical protein ACET3X_004656 [Alternaria dauci]|uniref:Uncharacterized protein n=1 Tax=Alternaria dauci TaxID=48095 RepID=A0ABR3UPT6_9PLEO
MKACRLLLNALPSWAVHVKFPTIQQMKESIEKNVSYKTATGANTQGTNTASQGNDSNGAAVDAGSTVPRIVNRQTMTKKQQADAAAAETGNPGSSSANTLQGGSAETAILVSSQGTMQQPGTNLSQLNGFAASFSPAAHSSGDLVQANMSRYFPSMSNTNATFPSEGASSGSIFQTPQRPSSIAPASQTYTPIGSSVHRDVSPRKKTKVGEDNSETRIPGLHHTGSFGVDDDYASPDYGRRRVPGSTSPTKTAPVGSTQTTEPVRSIGRPKPSTIRPIGSGSQRLEDAVSTQRGRSDAAATVGLGPIGRSVRQASFAPGHEDNSDMMSEASADMDIGDGSSSEDGSDEEDAGSEDKESGEVDDSVLGDEDEDMDSDTDTVKGGNDSDDEDVAVSGDMGKGKAKA